MWLRRVVLIARAQVKGSKGEPLLLYTDSLETRIVVDKCGQDMNGFETRLSDIRFIVQEQRRKKGGDRAAASDSTA